VLHARNFLFVSNKNAERNERYETARSELTTADHPPDAATGKKSIKFRCRASRRLLPDPEERFSSLKSEQE